jgi:hypothetical protein
MEEQPISIPNIEEQAANEGTTTPPRRQRAESGKRCPNRKPRTEATDRNAQTNVPREATDNDDFDFSDVSVKMRQLSKEDIVAAAEDEAFN